MPLPTIASVYRAQATGVTPAGTPWSNTFHFKDNTGSFTPGNMAVSIDNSLQSLYGTGGSPPGWGSVLDQSWQWLQLRVTPLFSNLASIVFTHSVAGTATGDALPPDTAMCISWRTSQRGPGFRGRTYLAGATEAGADANGRITTSVLGVLQAQCNDFLADLATANISLVIAHYGSSTSTVVQSASIDNVFDRQRRRRT